MEWGSSKVTNMKNQAQALHKALFHYQTSGALRYYQTSGKEEARVMLSMAAILQEMADSCRHSALGSCAAQCRDQELESYGNNRRQSLLNAELLIAGLDIFPKVNN